MVYNVFSKELIHSVKTEHSDMINCMVAVPCLNLVVSVGRDRRLFVWKFINHNHVTYLEYSHGSSSSESNLNSEDLTHSNYLFEFETDHKS